jgi:hypothetical protein
MKYTILILSIFTSAFALMFSLLTGSDLFFTIAILAIFVSWYTQYKRDISLFKNISMKKIIKESIIPIVALASGALLAIYLFASPVP